MNSVPQRIVCLSAEAADWLWRIGAWDRVVGVTAYFEIPPDTLPKPRISGFSTAKLEEIGRLRPDLIITFSDVQAQLAAEFTRRGFAVLATNQRTLEETESTLALIARIVDREAEAEQWLGKFREQLTPIDPAGVRPRVYFEEWNNPLITGIAWVSEIIERAGGQDLFVESRTKRAALERVVSSDQVCRADPEFIFASWCGLPVQTAQIASRPGWNDVAAVRNNRVHEIAGDDILQPGFRLVYGYERIKQHLEAAGEGARL